MSELVQLEGVLVESVVAPLVAPAARVNWGRWVVDCPRCPSALSLPPQWPVFDCWDCGARAEVEWPSPELVAGIERLLSMRPQAQTRSWHPGETLHDLLAENVEHGVMNDLALEAGAGQVFAIVGDRITVDELPAGPNRITAPAPRPALEG